MKNYTKLFTIFILAFLLIKCNQMNKSTDDFEGYESNNSHLIKKNKDIVIETNLSSQEEEVLYIKELIYNFDYEYFNENRDDYKTMMEFQILNRLLFVSETVYLTKRDSIMHTAGYIAGLRRYNVDLEIEKYLYKYSHRYYLGVIPVNTNDELYFITGYAKASEHIYVGD